MACSAEIAVPERQRAVIIGRSGATNQQLQTRTAARVHVPGKGRPAHHTVRVEAEDIADLLHLCWELTTLGIGRDELVECTLATSEGSAALSLQQQSSGEFLAGSGLSAFCLASRCSRDDLDIFVDNERFARPELSASCIVKQGEEHGKHLVFVYGPSHEEPRALFQGLVESTRAAEIRAVESPAGMQSQAAGIVVFRRQNDELEFLLVQAKHGGHWTPPKGHIHRDGSESELAAALRETSEETGISSTDLTLWRDGPGNADSAGEFMVKYVSYVLPRPTKKVPTGVKTTTYFAAELVKGAEPRASDDAVSVRWTTLSGAIDLCQQVEMTRLLTEWVNVITRR